MVKRGDAAWRRSGRPFVGRDREAAELAAGLEDAVGGRGRLFLIAGEPGIGKTWLADHLASHARQRGVRVLWGRCWEGAGAPPFWPWAQIVRALADGMDADTLAAYAGGGAAQLIRMVPALTGRLGDPATPVPESDAARFYLFEATTGFLGRAAAAQPLLLILDDLHAADDASLLLLRFLTQDLAAARLLVVGIYREVPARPGIGDAVGSLAREAHLISLGGLDRDDVHSLVDALAGSAPAAAAVAGIHEATGGNPLFVREAVRLLGPATSRRLDWRGVPIPETVRAVIRQRLAPLPADAVQVLSAAAVVGRDFDLPLLGPASGLPADRVLAALSEAVALGVAAEVPGTVGTWRFTHALMREVIYEQLPLPARTQLHRRVGEAIEQRYGTGSRAHIAELARHFAMVAAAGEAAKALEYARRAGERVMGASAYEEAVTQYRRALHALTFAVPDEALRGELLLRLGTAQAHAGAYEDARETHRQAAEISRRLGLPEQLARAALGFGEPQAEAGTVNRDLVMLLEEALAELPPDDRPLRARLLARLSLELVFADDPTRSDELSAAAVGMARRLGDPATLGNALRAAWMTAWMADGLVERAAVAGELVGLAQATGDRDLELIGRARQAASALETGDLPAAQADIAAHARLAGELRMPVHTWTATTLRALQALLHGTPEEAERLAEAAAAMQPDRPNVQFAYLDQLSLLRWEQGRLGELRSGWQQFADRFPHVGFGRAWLALADAESGHADDARRALGALAEELPEQPRHGLWLPAMALAALACARLDAADAAGRLYPLLRPYAGHIITIAAPHPVACLGSAAFHLALLASTASRWVAAAEHFEAAARVHERLAARPLLARTWYEHARMLIRRGRAADRRDARALLERADATAKAAGMSALGEQIAALLELDGGGPQAAGGTVFRRDGDYWTVSYEGLLVRLKDSKGLRHLARLLGEPGREFHVVDLEIAERQAALAAPASAAGAQAAGLTARPDLGDAGALLDATAKAAYKARLGELRKEVDDAEGAGDADRASRARDEIGALARELARAVGLDGRDRLAADHAERARLNVTRAIHTAIGKLAQANPPLGRHLATTVRTGRYCAYVPDPRAPIVWER